MVSRWKDIHDSGLRLLLNPFFVAFFNHVHWVPQQFTALSFVALTVFNCINAHLVLGGNLGLGHFLYYFQATRSSRNNRHHRSPQKKVAKDQARKDKGKAIKVEPVDLENYKK